MIYIQSYMYICFSCSQNHVEIGYEVIENCFYKDFSASDRSICDAPELMLLFTTLLWKFLQTDMFVTTKNVRSQQAIYENRFTSLKKCLNSLALKGWYIRQLIWNRLRKLCSALNFHHEERKPTRVPKTKEKERERDNKN